MTQHIGKLSSNELDEIAEESYRQITKQPPQIKPEFGAGNYSMKDQIAAIRIDERNKTLELTEVKLNEIKQVDDNLQYYLWLEDVESVIESLRNKEHP